MRTKTHTHKQRHAHNQKKKKKKEQEKKKNCHCHHHHEADATIALLSLGSQYPRLQSLYTHLLPPSSCRTLHAPSVVTLPISSSFPQHSCRCHNAKKYEEEDDADQKKNAATTALLAAVAAATCKEKGKKKKTKKSFQKEMKDKWPSSFTASWKWEKTRKEEQPQSSSNNPFLVFPAEFKLSDLHQQQQQQRQPPTLSPFPPSIPPTLRRGRDEDSKTLLHELEEEMGKLFLQPACRSRRPPPSTTKKVEVLDKLSTLVSPSSMSSSPANLPRSPQRQHHQHKKRQKADKTYEGPPWVPP
jgi:hypothetical protein